MTQIDSLCINYRDGAHFRSFVPFAIFSALAFSLPYLAVAAFVGPEAPSIIGGITALVAIAFAAKHGFLLPALPDELTVASTESKPGTDDAADMTTGSMLRSVMPFLVMSLALILSRTIDGARHTLQGITIRFGSFGGAELEELTPLYTPYAYLALAFVTAFVTLRVDREDIKQAAAATYKKLGATAIVLFFIIGLTQLMLISEMNQADLPAIPAVLGKGLADIMGGAFVIFSGFLGAIGSFMTGSATVSALLFGGLQLDAARALERAFAVVLALQLIGASVGNMISLSNIAMACGAAGVESKEGTVMRGTIVPVVVICLIAGLFLYFR